jgi:hypothetical protein
VLAVRGDMRTMTLRTALAALGALLAFAPAADAQTTPRGAPPLPRTAPAPVPSRGLPPLPAPVECRPASSAPPSQALLGALGVLRRPAEAKDALPADVLRLLRGRGLAPVNPASARLLRTTAGGGRAWIVPVPDVGMAGFVLCAPRRREAAEGVVVVSKGGAPAGGGAALADLVRGRGAVEVDVCAGPNRDMLGVSGVVPDGVGAAYLTSPDGTAVRADVVDNGYAFIVPRPRRPQQRYVVWIGGDGTPHVQPVPSLWPPRGSACRRLPAQHIRVTPAPFACLAPFEPAPAPLPAGRIPRLLPAGPCAAPPVPAGRLPRPSRTP